MIAGSKRKKRWVQGSDERNSKESRIWPLPQRQTKQCFIVLAGHQPAYRRARIEQQWCRVIFFSFYGASYTWDKKGGITTEVMSPSRLIVCRGLCRHNGNSLRPKRDWFSERWKQNYLRKQSVYNISNSVSVLSDRLEVVLSAAALEICAKLKRKRVGACTHLVEKICLALTTTGLTIFFSTKFFKFANRLRT